MAYRILLKPSAARELDRLPIAAATRIERKINELALNPRPPGVVKMLGADSLWRVRSGDYRIVYEIHETQVVVLVLRVAHRKDVYRER